MNKILFVCKFNRFRSQLATGWFNKLNKNKKYIATSSGIIKGNPIGKEVRRYAKENKLKLSSPRSLERSWLNKQDIIIIVADDVPPSIFKTLKKHGRKVIVWKIKDTGESESEKFLLTINKIKKKVEKLVKELK